MPSANCFDASTLKDYLLGKLSDEQSDVVAAHLEACLRCEATVSQLDRASDTLTNGLRLPVVAAEPVTDAGEVDGTHFRVMEYVEGCDLNTPPPTRKLRPDDPP
jgi:hypothetical protein